MLDENVDARLAFTGFSQASHIAEQMFLRFGDDEESQRRGTPGSGGGAVPRGKHRDVVRPSGCGAVGLWGSVVGHCLESAAQLAVCPGGR